MSFLLLFGALTTYWDFVFGYDNFFAHGFMCGLAAAPLIFYGEPLALGIRLVILSLGMGVWSLIVGKDWLEEGGRGALLPLTLALVLWL